MATLYGLAFATVLLSHCSGGSFAAKFNSILVGKMEGGEGGNVLPRLMLLL